MPIFRQLSQDEQDTIRVQCLNSLIPLAKHLTKEENQIHTLGTLLAASEDKSWKVRLAFAKSFPDFASVFGKDITDNNLVQSFCNLMKDNEAEVRVAAVSNVNSKCLECISAAKIKDVVLKEIKESY